MRVHRIIGLIVFFFLTYLPAQAVILLPSNELYHVSGSISYLVLDDQGELKRETQSYNITDQFPVDGEVRYSGDVYASSQANLLSVQASAFGGGIYDPYYGGSIGQSHASTAWSFQPMTETIRFIFRHKGEDSYYPNPFEVTITDESTHEVLFDLEKIMTPWVWKEERFNRNLNLTHTYRLEMSTDAYASGAGAGGTLELIIIPEPTVFIFLLFGFTCLRKRGI